MVRNIVGVVAGVIAAGIVVGLLEGLGHLLFPPPAGVDISRPDALAGVMEKIPLGAKIAVVVAWALGSMAGGCTAAWVAASRKAVMAGVVGGVVMGLGGYSLATIPHPVWMAVLGVALPVPMALLGAKLERMRRGARP